jgi:hypothetical protein
MKTLIIAAVALISLVYLNRRRLQVFTNSGLRIYLGIAIVAVLVALSFGPPKYVLFKSDVRMAEIDGNTREVYPGWKLNRLLPIEAFATPVLYGTRWGYVYPARESDIADLEGRFLVPGDAASRFLWIILILGVVSGAMVVRYVCRILEVRKALAIAQSQNTANAYNRFIERYHKGFFRPRRLLRQAENGRSGVYNRYILRMAAMEAINKRQVRSEEQQLNSSNLTAAEQEECRAQLGNRQGYGRVLKLLSEALSHNRDHGTTGMPFRLELSPGISTADFTQQHDTPLVLLEATRDDAEERLTRALRLLGIPDFSEILDQHVDQVKAARAGMGRDSWEEFSQLSSAVRHRIENDAQPELSDPTEVRNLKLIAATYAHQYLFTQLTSSLPVNREFRRYRRCCEAAIGDFVLEAFNRFFPDEQDDQGKLAMFRGWSPQLDAVLKADLAYTGSAFTSGLIPCKVRFSFIRDGQVLCDRTGRPAPPQENMDVKKRPFVDMLYNCVTAFSPPSVPRVSGPVTLPKNEAGLRKLLEKLDDEINEQAKELARGELEELFYEQLPDELHETVVAVNHYIEQQLDALTDEAIEMAGTLLDLLLNSGGDDE